MHKIIEQKKGEQGTVIITLSLPEEEVMSHKETALKHLNEHIEIDGFRKGKIPQSVLIQKVGEQALLEECTEHAIESVYADVVTEAKIHPIAHPKIVITKITKGSPVELTLTFEVMPEITLPDFKKIAKKAKPKQETIEVTEKEIEDVLAEIKHYHQKEGEAEVEVTDELVQKLGDFKDLADFKTKITENLKKEKEAKVTQTVRKTILDAITKETQIEVPNTFIERELDQMTHEFSYELSRMGQTFENYKTISKKTEEEIREEWKEKAKARVIDELVLQKIADTENIKPDEQKVKEEVTHMVEHYPDTPKERIQAFVEDMQTKQEVFKFLESQE